MRMELVTDVHSTETQATTYELSSRECFSDSDTSCPNAGVWPYVFAVLYFVHLKLILLTVLYALFR